MTTIINQTDETMYVTAQRDNGQSYNTTIPPGGGWAVPSDVVAVLVTKVD